MKINGRILGSNITSNVNSVSGMFTINNTREYIISKQWPVSTYFDLNITGGNVTYGEDGFKYHQYDGSGGFNIIDLPYPVELHILQVAGGGAGGSSSPYPAGQAAAGGGAGGWLESNILVSNTGSYAVLVGSGGNNSNGSNTSIVGLTANAVGGGRGAGLASPFAANGGSGGGGYMLVNGTQYAAGSGVSGQGNPGGISAGQGPFPLGTVVLQGGGGGASLIGGNATLQAGGFGGAGKQWVNSLWYGGGGGGGGRISANSTPLPGTQGYGGGGASTQAGTVNTGGGGGSDASGGSGVVIIRYRYR